ncbi:MAG TPA: peptide-methionine (R)-S-oxide reductase MsrB [Caulobacteraceae bacterium]|jgi:peptide-methionine (R)-S-oxide reductase
MISRRLVLASGTALAVAGPSRGWSASYAVTLTEVQWKSRLNPTQYEILRKAATEIPGSSPLLKEHRLGTFACAGCDQDLFSSKTKFESGTGWPSFWQPLTRNAVITKQDRSIGMVRTEVLCSRCGGHLGHVFDDGPRPTGLRYCMNGGAMSFHPARV